jgi:hypothetical protein
MTLDQSNIGFPESAQKFKKLLFLGPVVGTLGPVEDKFL